MSQLSIVSADSHFLEPAIFSTFQFEGPGIDAVRKLMGSQSIMWGNDFPHLDSTWPKSRSIIKDTLTDIMPAKDVDNIVYNNVAKLYGLEMAA